MSAPSITKADDVIEYLVAQHETIKKLFVETLDAADVDTQRAAFTKLRTLLAVHETAEEMIVHPRVRRKISGGTEIVDERLAEEHDSKVALSELEGLEPQTSEFSKALIHLQAAVTEHAEHEETLEFPALRDGVDASELAKLAEAVDDLGEMVLGCVAGPGDVRLGDQSSVIHPAEHENPHGDVGSFGQAHVCLPSSALRLSSRAFDFRNSAFVIPCIHDVRDSGR